MGLGHIGHLMSCNRDGTFYQATIPRSAWIASTRSWLAHRAARSATPTRSSRRVPSFVGSGLRALEGDQHIAAARLRLEGGRAILLRIRRVVADGQRVAVDGVYPFPRGALRCAAVEPEIDRGRLGRRRPPAPSLQIPSRLYRSGSRSDPRRRKADDRPRLRPTCRRAQPWSPSNCPATPSDPPSPVGWLREPFRTTFRTPSKSVGAWSPPQISALARR